MIFISWNVNGLRAVERKGEIQNLLEKENPDFLLLQEIKGKKEQFSKFLTENPHYKQFYNSASKPGYAGTGIWVKESLFEQFSDVSLSLCNDVPKNPVSDEGRILHLQFIHKKKKFSVLSIYFPNGGKSHEAWQNKLIFFDCVLDYMNTLRENDRFVIVGGDMNVAHTEIDLARPKENDGKIGFHPNERSWFDRVLENGWIDVWRSKNKDVKNVYSYWDTFTRSRERNVGWRIDYFFMDQKKTRLVKRVSYIQSQMGSDHCPIVVGI